uniref:Indoleamine 2,3-dioxygenase 1 n=2 Tax=Iconisemion striatum TaxID=60296 RepID=A0A1A7X0S5_9TELE
MAASSGITGALEVMHAMKISDLIGIHKGLIKVTQSLKKMKETFQLMHNHHQGETGDFLTRMRDYMPPAHRQLIETLSVCRSLRDFVITSSSSDLCQAYNSCVSALADLRSYHLNTVAKFVIVPGNQVRSMGCPLRGVGSALNTTGTGGSNLMVFLKSVRNTTQKALILERPTTSRETEM